MADETQAERSTSPKSRMTFKDNKEFIYKPIIRDILRTDACISGSILLVEKLENIEATVLNPAATRLLMGDGELCIQAFLSPHMGILVEGGEISTGCYARLDKFSIERIDVEGHEDSVRWSKDERPRKRKRQQQVVFLKIEKLETVGWDFAYMKHARPALNSIATTGSQQSRDTPDFDEGNDVVETNEIEYASTKGVPKRSSSGSVSAESLDLDLQRDFRLPTREDHTSPAKYTNSEELNHDLDLISQEEYQDDSPNQVEESIARRLQVPKPDEIAELTNPSKVSQELDKNSRQPGHPHLADNLHPETPKEVKQIPIPSRNLNALVPRTLAALSKLPARQNSPCTVFAIIDEIAPVKPCPIPPNKTREVRLVDPSTTKRVLLSVLWQPENFAPEVGTPVLLRGLKNHRYDGGSLNAYPKSVSPFTQNADGSDWWIPFPRGWDGCDVDGYLEWWEERQKEKKQKA